MDRKRDLKLEKYQDKTGQWRWRVMAGNGEQLARSPRGYDTVAEVDAVLAEILGRKHDAHLFRDRADEWRWRFLRGGSIMAIGSEGYKNRSDCKMASDLFLDAVPRG